MSDGPETQRIEKLRSAARESISMGDIAHASHMSFRLGEALERRGEREGAESAYRQSVVLSRQVGEDDPELMLAAFTSLFHFLAPSEESFSLAQEMAGNLINRDEMYHPMRAAEAAYHWAVTELAFAEVTPHRIDHVIEGIARTAIEALNDVCFHNIGQALQRRVAEALRRVGRGTEAEEWQAAADKYEDWDEAMDQVIPGHVHLWDIRFSLSGRDGARDADHIGAGERQ